jgi:WD40 repeat protein
LTHKLALASSDGVMIYNASTLDLVSVLRKDINPRLIKWSPDGSLLAVLYFGDDLSIWEPDSRTEVSNIMMRIPPVNGKLSWSPEGDRIGMDIIDKNAAPSILDSMTGNPVLELEPIGRYCPVFVFSPDGKSLAGGCYNSGDGIWDATTGEQLLTFDLSIDVLVSWTMDIVWSPQGDRVAFSVVKSLAAIEVFDANTGQTLADFPAHEAEIFELIWTPDGERLISASYDNTIVIWNLETLEEIKKIYHFGELDDIALSPDGKQLIVIRTDGILIQIDIAALLDG